MFRRPSRKGAAVLAAAMLLSTRAGGVEAAALTWDNGAGDGLWTSASNWDTDTVPGPGDSVLFPDPIPGTPAITLTGTQSVSGLTFKQAYTLGGGTLNLVTASLNASTGITGTINSIVSGSAGLTKTGGGTVVLGGANSFSGLAAVSAGVLSLANSSALGSTATGASVALGASLELSGSGLNIPDALSLNGGGIATARSLANVANNNTWSGTISLAAGSAVLSDSGTLSINVVDGTGLLYIGGAGNVIVNGSIKTGTNGVTKIGAGTVTLVGLNTNTGMYTVQLGTLKLGASDRIAGPLSVSAGATFDLAGFGEGVSSFDGAGTLTSSASGGSLSVGSGNGNMTFSGTITGTMSLTKLGTGTLTLSGANTNTGATNVSAGVLRLNENSTPAALGASADVSSNATIEISGPAIVPGTGTLHLTGLGFTSGGALRKTGVDTMTFGGAIEWRGITLAARVNADAGTLLLSGSQTTSGSAPSYQFGGAGNIVVSGPMGAGSRVFYDGGGTLTIGSSANSFTGGVTVSSGTILQAGDTSETTGTAGSTGLTPASTIANYVQLSNGAKMIGTGSALFLATRKGISLGSGGGEIGVTPAGDLNTYGGVISGTGPFTYSGPGEFSTSATHTYTGATNVTGGKWNIGAPLPAGTALTVSSGAILNSTVTSNWGVASIAGSGTILMPSLAAFVFSFGDATSTTFGGTITSTLSSMQATLNKTGAGILTLTSNAFPQAAVQISGGTMKLGSGGGLPDTKRIDFTASGTFDMNALDDTVGSVSGPAGAAIITAGTLRVGADGSSASFAGTITGSQAGSSLIKQGSGTQTLGQFDVGAVSVEAGVMKLAPTSPAARGTSLSIAGGANLDVTTANLIVRGQPVAQVQSLAALGRLTSSSAVSGTGGVAVARADALGLSTFGGRSVLASDVLVRYAYLGDADLGGAIDGDDFFRIDTGFNGALSGWANGDFNYSGTIDADDYFLINRNYSRNLPALGAAAPVGVTSVPEPGAVALLAAGILLQRRRHILSNV